MSYFEILSQLYIFKKYDIILFLVPTYEQSGKYECLLQKNPKKADFTL